jgi:hypothetical protein
VARYTSLIAEAMGLTDALVAKVRLAAAVHDVGKINVPRAILNKPGRLTDDEFELMKRHASDGSLMVSILDDEELTSFVRHHHERLDGTGYPDGLSGDAIPLGARIIAVADTFDAIISTRPYRRARSHKQAMDVLVADAGSKLDKAAVQAFRRGYAGRRELGMWVIVAGLPQRLFSWLGADLSAAGVAPLQASVAAVALAGALGGPFLRLHATSAPQQHAVSISVPAVVQATRAARPASVRSAVGSGPVARTAVSRRSPVRTLRTGAAGTVAVPVGGVGLSVPAGGPSQRGGGAPSGGAGSAGAVHGQPGSGSGGHGGSGGPPLGPGGTGGSGRPGGVPAPDPTLTDRIVVVMTAITNRVPAPAGPVGTGVVKSLSAPLDRIIPPPV